MLPIVFYDGGGNWTAATNFLDRTAMSDIFEKYIPKFEYEVINLSKYSVDDLVRLGDALSLIMIIDKIKSPKKIKQIIGRLPQDYMERLTQNLPDHLKELIVKVITVLLTKINAPQKDIGEITEKIKKRGFSEMFAIQNYDVQETRRIAYNEGEQRGEQRGERKNAIKNAVKIVRTMKMTVKDAMDFVELPPDAQQQVVSELDKLNIPYTISQ